MNHIPEQTVDLFYKSLSNNDVEKVGRIVVTYDVNAIQNMKRILDQESSFDPLMYVDMEDHRMYHVILNAGYKHVSTKGTPLILRAVKDEVHLKYLENVLKVESIMEHNCTFILKEIMKSKIDSRAAFLLVLPEYVDKLHIGCELLKSLYPANRLFFFYTLNHLEEKGMHHLIVKFVLEEVNIDVNVIINNLTFQGRDICAVSWLTEYSNLQAKYTRIDTYSNLPLINANMLKLLQSSNIIEIYKDKFEEALKDCGMEVAS